MKICLAILISICSVSVNANDSTRFKIEVLNIAHVGKYQKLVEDAVALLNEVLNSDEFKTEMMQLHFDWQNLASPVKDSVSNAMVFDSLYLQMPLAKINLRFKHRGLRLGTYFSGTAGTTPVGGNTTYTYTYWLDLSDKEYQCTLLSYASHIAHEYCHQRGFWDKNVTNQSDYRDVVPYAIGDIVCALLNKQFNSKCKCDE